MINMDELSARLGNNMTIVQKILAVFSAQYGEKPSVFGEAMASKNTEAIYQLAHSVKGALANVCAEADAALASEIEGIAREGAIPPQELVQSLEQKIRDINEQIANI